MITRRLARPAGQIASSSSWTCPSCRGRTSFLQTIPKPSSRRTYAIAAAGHRVPKLHHDDYFQKNGVPGLFSDQGYKVVWTDYQKHLLDHLNELVAGTPIEDLSVKDMAIMFARDPMNAAVFNYASAAVNNHQFLSTLAPRPIQLNDSLLIRESLLRTFGSVETLRSTMIDTAASMFGPGYVWLVWARNVDPNSSTAGAITPRSGAWRILTTYLAGTPYPEAGFRQQGVDMNNQNPSSYKNYLSNQSTFVNNTAGAFGAHSFTGKNEARIPPGGTSIDIVLCVSTWQHAYLRDFGVNGKRQFLNKWWDCIDWNAVEAAMPSEARTASALQFRGRNGQ